MLFFCLVSSGHYTSIWYQIRGQLKEQFGKNLDRAWLSKLNAKENLQTKTLTLFAPTNFIRDYINNKYGSTIRQFSSKLGLQFVEFITKEQALHNVI